MTDVNVSPLRLNIHGGFVVVNLTWAVVEMVVEVVEVVEEVEEVEEASDGSTNVYSPSASAVECMLHGSP